MVKKIACLFFGLFIISSSAYCDTKRPNILFIFTDDQRADAIGYAGNSLIKTPTLDQLAQQGVVFDNAFVNTSICAISRANLLIGQYPSRHGITDFYKTFSTKQLNNTYPARLRRAGYVTGFVGKWGVGHTHENTYQAVGVFDFWAGGAGQMNYWYDENSPFVRKNGHDNFSSDEIKSLDMHQADKEGMTNPLHLTTQVFPLKVNQFLAERDKKKPFMLSLFFKAPHGPWSGWDSRYKNLYSEQAFPAGSSVSSKYEAIKPDFLRHEETMLGASAGRHWTEDRDARDLILRDYYRLITGIDDSVGEIIKLLEVYGVADNTVIIYTSDNGFSFGEHGMAGKWLMREPSIRVPAFIFDPRLEKENRGQHVKQQIITTDFTATFLDLAGIAPSSDVQGMSLWPFIEPDTEKTAWRTEWFYEHPYTHNGQLPFTVGIRGDRYKYTRYLTRDPVFEEFFDLQMDPEELVNLIDDEGHRELVADFREKTDLYLRDSGIRPLITNRTLISIKIMLAVFLITVMAFLIWRRASRTTA